MGSMESIYRIVSPKHDLRRLCNEQDVAWCDFIKAARKLQARLPLATASQADRNKEQRAWARVCEVRTRLDEFINSHFEIAPEIDSGGNCRRLGGRRVGS